MISLSPTSILLPLRRLRRDPMPALLAVMILALTTGAAALVFTLVDALLLDPLPFADPDRLVRLEAKHGGVTGQLSMRELRDIGDLAARHRSLWPGPPPFSPC